MTVGLRGGHDGEGEVRHLPHEFIFLHDAMPEGFASDVQVSKAPLTVSFAGHLLRSLRRPMLLRVLRVLLLKHPPPPPPSPPPTIFITALPRVENNCPPLLHHPVTPKSGEQLFHQVAACLSTYLPT